MAAAWTELEFLLEEELSESSVLPCLDSPAAAASSDSGAAPLLGSTIGMAALTLFCTVAAGPTPPTGWFNAVIAAAICTGFAAAICTDGLK